MFKQNTGCLSSGVAVAFVVTFISVFVVVAFMATVVTFILPEAYASTAMVKLNLNPAHALDTNQPASAVASARLDPTTVETESIIIQSELILDPVIEQLDLNEVWRKKYNSDTKFRTSDCRAALRRMLEVRPIRDTSLINITVYSDDKSEAAKIANAIGEEYLRHLGSPGQEFSGVTSANPVRAFIIEHAQPSSRPVRPNKPLNIVLGIILGTVLGAFAGGVVALIVHKVKRGRNQPTPGLPQS